MESSQHLQSLVGAFVRDIEIQIRHTALDVVATALGAKPSASAPSPVAARATPPHRGRTARAAATKPTPRQLQAGRRSPEQIDALAEKIRAHIAQHPGERAEEIKSALKIAKAEWVLPVQQLLREGKLATQGNKRATTYTAK